MTTHGQIDQILPSQFALDEWDFFRRFAEHELLYFRREDPHEQTRQELVVLLDQGVRTWGEVRLVLGAALLALGKQASQRGCPFLLTTNSVNLIDPLQVDEDSLGEIVESSDLSMHPGLALERLLEQPSKTERDIVLLTHPRNLDEEDVRAAAKRLRPGARLFALTLDRHGQAELSEFKHGAPVPIRQFHVDFSAASGEPATTTPKAEIGAWTGAVEPLGFPFRFGIGGMIGARSFDFDLAGKYLLAAGPMGVLHLWEVGGGLVEILPRAVWQGKVLNWGTPSVLGVANGFVVVGTFDSRPMAVHYDLQERQCTCRPVGESSTEFWEYSPAHHCLIVPNAEDGRSGLALDLSTGEVFATNLGGRNNRAQEAWQAWERRQIPSRHIRIAQVGEKSPKRASIYVDANTGSVQVTANPLQMDPRSGKEHSAWAPTFTPHADGRPMLQNCSVLAAQLGGPNLALQTTRLNVPNDIHLHLIRSPVGIPLGEHQISHAKLGFRLSADGSLLARQIRTAMIQISQVAGNVAPLGRTVAGGFVQQLPFVLGKDRIMLLPGQHALLIEWSSGTLKFAYHSRGGAPEVKQGIVATPTNIPEPCKYDSKRWLLGASNTLLAASDRYGQLAVFDRQQKLICMFFAFRMRLAGWMPDGTSFVHVKTADEATVAHFGRALQAASRSG